MTLHYNDSARDLVLPTLTVAYRITRESYCDDHLTLPSSPQTRVSSHKSSSPCPCTATLWEWGGGGVSWRHDWQRSMMLSPDLKCLSS